MNALDIILKKRDGAVLSRTEISAVIDGFIQGNIPDYQMAAWLMAIFFRGMTDQETADLTMAMADSGARMDLTSVPGVKVDKHSTGGVSDTTTLIIAPLVAAAGVKVAKMSGRGLGFTGGTIDKLEAIPGFQTSLSNEEFLDVLKKYGLAIVAQTKDLVPADGKIYSLRDVTGTVESIPLIASSIMSKKIAAGAEKIVLDVKVGSGAFMKNLESAVGLALTMVRIGSLVGRETRAVITNMNQPLGYSIGNSLEVKEAIEVLSGRSRSALREVCLVLGVHMLVMAKPELSACEAYSLLVGLLEEKHALKKFGDLIVAQGGNARIIAEPELLPAAKHQVPVISERTGYVQSMSAAELGYCAMRLGAGRETKADLINPAAGIVMACRVGDYVEQGQPLCILHTDAQEKIPEVSARLKGAITIGAEKNVDEPMIYGIVDRDGFHAERH